MEKNIPYELMLIAPIHADFRRHLVPEAVSDYVDTVEGFSADEITTEFMMGDSISGFDPAGFTILRHRAKAVVRDDYSLLGEDAVADGAYGIGVMFAKKLYLKATEASDEPMPLLSSSRMNDCAIVSDYLDNSKLRSMDVLTMNYRQRYPEIYESALRFARSLQGKFSYGITYPDDIVRGFHDYFCVITKLHCLSEAEASSTVYDTKRERGIGLVAVNRAS